MWMCEFWKFNICLGTQCNSHHTITIQHQRTYTIALDGIHSSTTVDIFGTKTANFRTKWCSSVFFVFSKVFFVGQWHKRHNINITKQMTHWAPQQLHFLTMTIHTKPFSHPMNIICQSLLLLKKWRNPKENRSQKVAKLLTFKWLIANKRKQTTHHTHIVVGPLRIE